MTRNGRIRALGLLLALALAAVWHHAHKPADSGAGSAPASGKPAKASGDGDISGTPGHSRRSSTDQELVAELIHFREQWLAGRPVDELPDLQSKAWDEEITRKLSKLETAQLAGLAASLYPEGYDNSKLRYYGGKILELWASRDYPAARALLLRYQALEKLASGDHPELPRNGTPGKYSNDFFHLREGFARQDPAAAWEELLRDMANPELKGVNPPGHAIGIFAIYAESNPDAAWQALLKAPDAGSLPSLLSGFGKGLAKAGSAGDWDHKLAELWENLGQRPEAADDDIRRALRYSFTAAWLREDPAAALDWYGNGPGGKGSSEERDQAKDLLLQNADASDLQRALGALIDGGEGEFAARVVQAKSENFGYSPWMVNLLDPFSRLPSASSRAEVLINAAGKLATAQGDPFGEQWPADAKATAAKGLRDQADRFSLPPDLREKVEVAIRQAEAGMPPQVQDPFGPGQNPLPPDEKGGPR